MTSSPPGRPPSPGEEAAPPTQDSSDDGAAAAAAAAPPFEPLFTLLANTTTNTTIHPHVHYIFSDDDIPILDGTADERTLIVDLAAENDAWTVAWASSLSGDFAVTGAEVQMQEQKHEQQQGMLRLEGVEREGVAGLEAAGSGGVVEDVDALMEDFTRRMGVLRRVVGEAGRRKTTEDDDEHALEHGDQQHTVEEHGAEAQKGDEEQPREEPTAAETGTEAS